MRCYWCFALAAQLAPFGSQRTETTRESEKPKTPRRSPNTSKIRTRNRLKSAKQQLIPPKSTRKVGGGGEIRHAWPPTLESNPNRTPATANPSTPHERSNPQRKTSQKPRQKTLDRVNRSDVRHRTTEIESRTGIEQEMGEERKKNSPEAANPAPWSPPPSSSEPSPASQSPTPISTHTPASATRNRSENPPFRLYGGAPRARWEKGEGRGVGERERERERICGALES